MMTSAKCIASLALLTISGFEDELSCIYFVVPASKQ